MRDVPSVVCAASTLLPGSSITKTGVSDNISDTQSSVHVAVSAISVSTSHLTPPGDMDMGVHMSDDITGGPLSNPLSSGAPTLAGNDAALWRMLSAAVMPDAHDIFASLQMPSQLFDADVSEERGKTISNPDNDDFDFGDLTRKLSNPSEPCSNALAPAPTTDTSWPSSRSLYSRC